MGDKVSDGQLTQEMLFALKERYSFPEWIFLSEVPDGTGAMRTRRADGFAFNLFPSKGFTKICFEIKASLSDLKKELEDGTKSNAVGQFANLFFLVCPENLWNNESILLPETWGILEYNHDTGKLRQKKKPTLYTPRPVDDGFAAALLQSLHRCLSVDDSDLLIALRSQEQKLRREYAAHYEKRLEEEKKKIEDRFVYEYSLDKTLLENVKNAYGREVLRFGSVGFQKDFKEFKNFLYGRDRIKSALECLYSESSELKELAKTLFINEEEVLHKDE